MRPVLFLVDDDYPTNRYHEIILSEIKEINSFQIFENSEVALNTLKTKTQKPSFLFLDINMPKLNGWECVEEIQKSPAEYLSTPFNIFMLTTSSSKFDLEKKDRFPLVQKIIEKPITEEIILEIIQETNSTLNS